jgi:hypothetical protein
MSRTVEIAFKGTRRGYYTAPESGDPLRMGESVVVEAERGRDLGRITALGEVADKKCGGCSGCSTSPVADSVPEAPP